MFEPSSVMTSIAEGGEFRFARFYIVCEAVPARDARESAHCLRVADTPVECSKIGKTRIIADAKTGGLEMQHFLIRISR